MTAYTQAELNYGIQDISLSSRIKSNLAKQQELRDKAEPAINFPTSPKVSDVISLLDGFSSRSKETLSLHTLSARGTNDPRQGSFSSMKRHSKLKDLGPSEPTVPVIDVDIGINEGELAKTLLEGERTFQKLREQKRALELSELHQEEQNLMWLKEQTESVARLKRSSSLKDKEIERLKAANKQLLRVQMESGSKISDMTLQEERYRVNMTEALGKIETLNRNLAMSKEVEQDLRQKLAFSESQCLGVRKSATMQLNQAEVKINTLTQEVDSLMQQTKKYLNELTQSKGETLKLRAIVERLTGEKQLVSKNGKKINQENEIEINELKYKLRAAEVEAEAYHSRLDEMKAELDGFNEHRRVLEHDISKTKLILETTRKDLGKATREKEMISKRLDIYEGWHRQIIDLCALVEARARISTTVTPEIINLPAGKELDVTQSPRTTEIAMKNEVAQLEDLVKKLLKKLEEGDERLCLISDVRKNEKEKLRVAVRESKELQIAADSTIRDLKQEHELRKIIETQLKNFHDEIFRYIEALTNVARTLMDGGKQSFEEILGVKANHVGAELSKLCCTLNSTMKTVSKEYTKALKSLDEKTTLVGKMETIQSTQAHHVEICLRDVERLHEKLVKMDEERKELLTALTKMEEQISGKDAKLQQHVQYLKGLFTNLFKELFILKDSEKEQPWLVEGKKTKCNQNKIINVQKQELDLNKAELDHFKEKTAARDKLQSLRLTELEKCREKMLAELSLKSAKLTEQEEAINKYETRKKYFKRSHQSALSSISLLLRTLIPCLNAIKELRFQKRILTRYYTEFHSVERNLDGLDQAIRGLDGSQLVNKAPRIPTTFRAAVIAVIASQKFQKKRWNIKDLMLQDVIKTVHKLQLLPEDSFVSLEKLTLPIIETNTSSDELVVLQHLDRSFRKKRMCLSSHSRSTLSRLANAFYFKTKRNAGGMNWLSKLDFIQATMFSLESKLNKNRSEKNQLQAKITRETNALTKANQQISDHLAVIKLFEERMDDYEEQLERSVDPAILQNIEKQLDLARTRALELEKERVMINTHIESLQKEVETQKSQIETLSAKDRELETIRAENHTLQTMCHENACQESRNQSLINKFIAEKTKAETERLRIEAKNQMLQRRISNLERELMRVAHIQVDMTSNNEKSDSVDRYGDVEESERHLRLSSSSYRGQDRSH